MTATTLSIDELRADPEAAQEAAHRGPVFIRSGDRAGSVLLSVEEYRALQERAETPAMGMPGHVLSPEAADFEGTRPDGDEMTLAEALGMPADAGDAMDWEIPQLSANMGFKIPDFD